MRKEFLSADDARNLCKAVHINNLKSKCDVLLADVLKAIKSAAEKGSRYTRLEMIINNYEIDKFRALIEYLEELGYDVETPVQNLVNAGESNKSCIISLSIRWCN